MKVLHVNTFDIGGAARSVIRLHKGLLQMGIESQLLCLHPKDKNAGAVYFKTPVYNHQSRITRFLNNKGLLLSCYEKFSRSVLPEQGDFEAISFPCTPFDITASPFYKDADIINLHWVGGFLDWPSFFSTVDKPVVWTMHDMNPILGLFHYESDSLDNRERFRTIEKKAISIKSKAIRNCKQPIVSVTPSNWLYQRVLTNKLFGKSDLRLIPYGVSTNNFRPVDVPGIKKSLGLNPDKKIILFVSQKINTKRKGVEALIKAIQYLEKDKYVVIAVGDNSDSKQIEDITYLGNIQEDSYLNKVYAMADIFVIPSQEDNFPNTVLEAMSSGTPVIGFDVGGVSEMIKDGINGYLASRENPSDLADKLMLVLNNPNLQKSLGENARRIAIDKYKLELQANRYSALYDQLMIK